MSKHIENNLDKEWVIKVKCSQCGKEFYSTKYQMRNSKSGHIFCCKECYWKYKRDHPIKYESTCKNTKCDNCGKDITLPPNRFNYHIENDTLKLNDTIINPYFIRTRNDSAAA